MQKALDTAHGLWDTVPGVKSDSLITTPNMFTQTFFFPFSLFSLDLTACPVGMETIRGEMFWEWGTQ